MPPPAKEGQMMSQSIKISDDEMMLLREEASISSRSIAGQAEHWLRIGRAIEKSEAFNYHQIRDALVGLVSPDELNAGEQEVFFDEFSNSMWEVTPEQEAFFSERKRAGLGVGLDANDHLVCQQPEKTDE